MNLKRNRLHQSQTQSNRRRYQERQKVKLTVNIGENTPEDVGNVLRNFYH